MTRPPRILAIAGSDSSGGAGIQADIKTITMLGGYAMTAITAVTAQNTTGVQAVAVLPADFVAAQIDSCLSDIGADAVKIGMLGSGRLVIRKSGTEPKIRVMAEGDDAAQVEAVVDAICAAVERAVA